MVVEPGAQAGSVVDKAHVQTLQVLLGADAGAEEHRRRLDRAAGQDDPAAFDHFSRAVRLHLDAGRAPAADDHSAHQRIRPDR